MRIFKSKPGELADYPCWVIYWKDKMLIHETFLGVIKLFLTERDLDKHLIG